MSIECNALPCLVLVCYIILFFSVAPCLISHSRMASDISAKSVCDKIKLKKKKKKKKKSLYVSQMGRQICAFHRFK